jgi:hypothetical protein
MWGGNYPWPESAGALVCWPELCRRRALDRGGDLARSRNCTRRSRASLAKSGRRVFCNRWVSRASRSSVLHWKEPRSPLVALARAFLPLVSTSIKPLQTGSLIDRTARNMLARWKRQLRRHLRRQTFLKRNGWPIQSRNLPTYSASIILVSIDSSSAESFEPVVRCAASCSCRARNYCAFSIVRRARQPKPPCRSSPAGPALALSFQ